MIVSFDAGKYSLAWAAFEQDVLTNCGFIEWSEEKWPSEIERRFRAGFDWAPCRYLIEYQQIYTSGRHRTRKPADVLACTLTVGRVQQALGQYAKLELVLPHTWKGSVKKEIMTERIPTFLSTAERAILHAAKVPNAKRHNVVDAIGLGLWGLRRLTRCRPPQE